MPRKKSRTQRKAAFMKAAEAMYEQMEDWYDVHPDASFEEIEAEMRQRRRELMGGTLETLIVGRDSGFEVAPPKCSKCGQPMTFEGYRPWTVKGLEGDSTLERAYYTCPACGEQGFFPLWTRSSGCAVTTGVRARLASPPGWGYKVNLSIWQRRPLAMLSGARCRPTACAGSRKAGARR